MSAELCAHCSNPGRSEEMTFSSDAEGWICEECMAETKKAAQEMFVDFKRKVDTIRKAGIPKPPEITFE